MAEQPDNLVLELLRGLRTEVGEVKEDIESVRNELKGDINSLRADVASDLLNMKKEMREQIGGVRRTLVDYHSSVVGHGIKISELQDRVQRIEQHLDLPPIGAH